MSICTKFRTIYNRLPAIAFPQISQTRSSSYNSSLFLEDVGPVNVKYEVSKDPVDWSYVERILPLAVVPEPVKKDNYPSGWKPQGQNLDDRPYFIRRTRNHMIPCYLKISQHGIKRHTILKNIKGDIWLLEKEIRDFLQPQSFQPIRLQVNEFAGYIRLNGDHVNAIKYFLEEREY